MSDLHLDGLEVLYNVIALVLHSLFYGAVFFCLAFSSYSLTFARRHTSPTGAFWIAYATVCLMFISPLEARADIGGFQETRQQDEAQQLYPIRNTCAIFTIFSLLDPEVRQRPRTNTCILSRTIRAYTRNFTYYITLFNAVFLVNVSFRF